MRDADVIVIGAGPGGLAAAASAGEQGARVLLLEREEQTGGILNQCVHDGFGLVRYQKQLGGPEYAARSRAEADLDSVTIKTGSMVTGIDPGEELTVHTVSPEGLKHYKAGAVVLATGCRERTRGMLRIPGSRPAGIYTAGVAQNLINRRNVMVGKRVVLLGTGDIGLIMARRLTLEGAQVLCALEIEPDACGLSRNVRQCLQDLQIPIYLSHTVTQIIGKGRLRAVKIAQVDENKRPILNTEREIACDTLILSVGLIPENEVARTAGVELDPATNTQKTGPDLMTNVPGVFACGNCKGILDLADYVSEEGEAAGRNAAAFARGEKTVPVRMSEAGHPPKGMPPENELTCILCPKGCILRMETDGSVTGNQCPKGLGFLEAELTDPVRILTSTVRVTGSEEQLLPVRSDRLVPLRDLRDLVSSLSQICVEAPVAAGEIIAENICGSGVNIIAQCAVDRQK